MVRALWLRRLNGLAAGASVGSSPEARPTPSFLSGASFEAENQVSFLGRCTVAEKDIRGAAELGAEAVDRMLLL
jgi:hypothetical protein